MTKKPTSNQNTFENSLASMMQKKSSKISRKNYLTRDDVQRSQQINPNEKLLFSDFQKCILDFQLKEHMDFLKVFSQIFKSIDHQQHGILNEDEFRSLLELMHSSCRDRIESR